MNDAAQAIQASRWPLVAGHINPDADCIASILVMHSALKSMGKLSRMILPAETVGRRFTFMLDLLGLGDRPDPGDRHDLIVIVDTSLRDRINLFDGYDLPANVPICNIDHHLGNEHYGQVNWVDPGCGGTSQMVFTLLESLGSPITREQASLLYAGLHGDTCGFSLRGTSSETLRVASRLADSGADVAWVCQKLYRCLAESEFRLMRLVYDNTRVNSSGRVAWSTIGHDELINVGCGPDDIDEQVAVPRSIDGVRIAILFSEPVAGTVRMNFRSDEDLNILPLARSLGGGGHAQAAGLIKAGRLADMVDMIVSRAEDYICNADAERD